MLFNSLSYAIFLPIVFALYWLVPNKFRWIFLLISSYYFYMSWKPKYVVLILLTTLVSYTSGLLIERYEKKSIKKMILIGTLVVCLGVLFVFKYYNFVLDSFAHIVSVFGFTMQPTTLSLLLPVGISFYTFQTLSYVIDIYNNKVSAEKHFGIYATFISFFPQLVAGPIERTSNLLPQIKSEKEFDYTTGIYGLRQILWGLFKKIAVADVVSVYVNNAYANIHNCTAFDVLVAIFFFSIQIYCDFSGYSDIAIGSAKLFGIQLMENFKSPYYSCSVKEFWARWHISLSTWFRDYVYIPLGGSRRSKVRNNINLLITFLVSGLWHGANWTFVFWGGLHGCAQILEKNTVIGKLSIKDNRALKIISWIIVFAFCNAAWVFFRAGHIGEALELFRQFFINCSHITSYLHSNIGLSKTRLLFIGLVILIVALVDYFSQRKDLISLIEEKPVIIRLAIEYVILLIIIYVLVSGCESSQFVYFQF